jgi:ISXO2-like transposase domain
VATWQAAVPHRREEPASYPADRDRQKTRPLARPRRSPDSRLQSGYALPSPRIRRHFLILIDALFSSYSPRSSKARNRKNHVPPKEAAFALVERDGAVRSFHVAAVDAKTLHPVLRAHVDKHSYLMTDESPTYIPMGRDFAGHGAVNHSIEEYVRGNFWHTNTIENYFSILKRGITGVYHHVSQQHLKRYLAEFDFRYNERAALGVNDPMRMETALLGILGRRVTYRDSSMPVAGG